MATIGTLAARILADASGIKSGLNLTRNELKVTREAFVASRTDTERYQAALDQLNAAKAKGAFAGNEAEYARALQAVRAQLDPAAIAANKLAGSIKATSDRLRDQAATAGMSADKLELYRLRQDGATNAQIAAVAALQQQRNAAQTAAVASGNLAGKAQQIGAGFAGSIPGVGGLINVLTAGHPVLVAMAAAAAAVVIAIKIGKSAWDTYTEAVGKAFVEIDAVSKQSRVLGTTIQDLRELRYAAGEIGDVDVSAFDGALETLQKNAADSAIGIGRAQVAFQALGLDAAKVRDAGAGEGFRMIADAMQRIESPAIRTQMAIKLFGDQGARLVNVLSGGRAAIDEAGTAVRRLTGSISEIDAGNVEAMRDEWGRVKLMLAGIAEQAAIDLAPALQVAAKELLELLKPGSTFGNNLKLALEVVPPILATSIDLANVFVGQFQTGQAAVMGMANALVQTIDILDRVQAALPGGKRNEALATFAQSYSQQTYALAAEAGQRMASGMAGGAAAGIEEIRRKAAAAVQGGQPPGGNPLSGVPEDAEKEVKTLAERVAELRQKLEDQIATAGMSAAQLELWRLATDAARATQEQLTAAERDDLQVLQRQSDARKEAASVQQDYEKTVRSLQEQAATAGMAAEEAERYRLAQRGLSAENLRVLESQQLTTRAAKEAAEASKTQQDTVAKLKEQIATTGMSADEAERWRLAERGVSKEALGVVQSLQAQAAAAKLREEFLSPADKMAREQARLKDLLDRGLIDQTLYAKAVDKARKEIEKPIVAEYKVEGVGAAIAGSREAAEAIQRHRAQMIDKNAKHVVKFVDAAGPLQQAPPPPVTSAPEMSSGQTDYFASMQAAAAQAEIDAANARQLLELQPDLPSTWTAGTAAQNPVQAEIDAANARQLLELQPDVTSTWTAGPVQPPADNGPADTSAVEDKLDQLVDVLRSLVPYAAATAANTGEPLQVDEVTV